MVLLWIIILLHDAYPAQDVVEVGHHHEDNQNGDAGVLGIDHKLIRRLAASNDLVKKEEHVATVEGGDGQNVHESKDDTQEGGHLPEHKPIPLTGEEAADGAKTAQTLRAVSREDILHVADITGQHIPAILASGGEALKEAVALCVISFS